MKTTNIAQFLTNNQIRLCIKLKTAKLICKEVIEPNIEEINKKLGQENDPMYLAYACEYVITLMNKDK